jgi:diadenosine tetraphosphate (Ap4A) HIT family hydrolase
MPAWHDLGSWERLRDGVGCPICIQGRPHGIVAELATSFVTVDPAVAVRGYCCVVARQHVVELHDLPTTVAAKFMQDLQAVSYAISEITGAVKLNYQIHGNTIPHLHVHVIPRYRGDELELPGKSLATLSQASWSHGEFTQFAESLKIALASSADEMKPLGNDL